MTALDQILAHLATSDAAARADVSAKKLLVRQTLDEHYCHILTEAQRELISGYCADIYSPHLAAIIYRNAVVRELAERVYGAPHPNWCASFRSTEPPCDCWKAEALQRAAERLQPAPAGKEGR